MKLYAFTTPDIPKNTGYLKIGETNGSITKRIKDQGHTLNTRCIEVWRDSVVTDRTRIDKRVHVYLREQGFDNPKYPDTGEYTELVKCSVEELQKAFEVIKQQIYTEEKLREAVGNQFYFEIRNWFYWAVSGDVCSGDYALRLIVRLMLCFFLCEKGLIPKELFNEVWLRDNLKEDGYKFYKVILHNLFFRCLNTPMKGRKNFENTKLIANISKVKEQFLKIPFLNGGLFNELEGDDFALPHHYFFAEKQKVQLTELGGEKCDVEGIIRLLSKYQYKLSLDDLLDCADYTKTIDPEFVGKVFESLLACIDADTNLNRRKVIGSYYTPREIVDYMVNESLDAYLLQRASGGTCSASGKASPFDNDVQKLLDVKILDPACGSGAFPCGIMNAIMNRIDPDSTMAEIDRYNKKVEILQNVIYGVDIQPMAVQIAVLRLFLSLIQDIVPDKKKDNYGIKPLPNLETKFVCADALIGLSQEKQGRLELPIVKATVKQLQLTRNQHLVASDPAEKMRLQEFDESLRHTLSVALEEGGDLSHDAGVKLASWNPYDQTNRADFFDSYYMFGVEKFDIVIGNPPYVESRSASVSDEKKRRYKEQVRNEFGSLEQYITQGSDLLVYFFPRSITFLSETGIGMLIVQNGWLNTDYGTKTSQFLTNTLQYIKITDSSFRHFDRASVNINTVIVEFKKQSSVKKVCFDVMEKNGSRIITKDKRSFNYGKGISSEMKWGIVMAADNGILAALKIVIEEGKTIDQTFYSIGQGINVKQNTFIPKKYKSKFKQKENVINAVFKEYQYNYTDYDFFLYHFYMDNKTDAETLKTVNAEVLNGGKTFTRKYPSIIMPRGIGDKHFAGLLTERALSNSFVDVYLDEPDVEKQLNIWLFCNSSLFFLYRELSGRKNLGGGLLKSEATDIKLLPLYFPIASKKRILTLLNKVGIPISIEERLNTDVQKKIDQLVFDYFDFSAELRMKITDELLRLFRFRYNKAK
ncbi:hypothetical protein FACS189427_07510 [Planctomycetales bacterium]|nr:hypothetical protein FACS189427_07510 [Planctomycetales bacterium]